MSEDTLNESILENEFNLNTPENQNNEMQEIRDMRNQLAEVVANTPDPDAILLDNINRANDLLDSAQRSIENGGENQARMYEVCAQLINAITSAATSVQNSTFGAQKHEYNMKVIEVKEKEVAVKEALALGKLENQRNAPSGSGTKIVAMTREDLLNMIEQEDAEVEVDSAGEQENTQE